MSEVVLLSENRVILCMHAYKVKHKVRSQQLQKKNKKHGLNEWNELEMKEVFWGRKKEQLVMSSIFLVSVK